jgi:hypothetical protein
MTNNQPNIVFFFWDNFGWGELGCYGSGVLRTPSRSALMTGRHPIRSGTQKTLAIEPPIKPGTPDPYLPPNPGEVRVEEHLQLGVITQYVSSLTRTRERMPEPEHGVEIPTG